MTNILSLNADLIEILSYKLLSFELKISRALAEQDTLHKLIKLL